MGFEDQPRPLRMRLIQNALKEVGINESTVSPNAGLASWNSVPIRYLNGDGYPVRRRRPSSVPLPPYRPFAMGHLPFPYQHLLAQISPLIPAPVCTETLWQIRYAPGFRRRDRFPCER